VGDNFKQGLIRDIKTTNTMLPGKNMHLRVLHVYNTKIVKGRSKFRHSCKSF